MSSKVMTASMPFVLFLYLLIYRNDKKIKKRIILVIPYFAIIFLWLFAVQPVFEMQKRFVDEYSLHYGSGFLSKTHLRVLVHMGIPLLRYIWVLFFPVNLVLYYPQILKSYKPEFNEILAIIMILSIIVIALRMRKKNKEKSFSILFFFLTLAPVLQIIPFNTLYAERYLYIPSTGFCMLIAVYLYLENAGKRHFYL